MLRSGARKASSSEVLGASGLNCNREPQVHWQSCWCKITDMLVGAELWRSLAPPSSLDGKNHAHLQEAGSGGQSAQPKSLQSQSSWKPFLGTWRTRLWLGTASMRLDYTQPTWSYSRTWGGSVQAKGEQWMLFTAVLATPFTLSPMASSVTLLRDGRNKWTIPSGSRLVISGTKFNCRLSHFHGNNSKLH